MTSFFEKLKKGMGVEERIIEEEPLREKKVKKARKTKTKTPPLVEKLKAATSEQKKPKKMEVKIESIEIEKEAEGPKVETKKEIEESAPISSFPKATKDKEKKQTFFGEESEGQLAIDIYQTDDDLVIQSAIAGVKAENFDISIEKDIITIKGNRENPFPGEGDYFFQECYWGPFSREVILPVEVDSNRARAEMKEGVLIIRIPKIEKEKKRKITVK